MNNGGFVSEECIKKVLDQLKEKPSWWLVKGKVVRCTSHQLKMIHEMIDKTE